MFVWIVRAIALIGAPILSYFLVSPNEKGIIAGVAFGLVIVGLDIVLKGVNLMIFVFGLVGATVGLLFFYGLDWTIVRLDSPAYLYGWTEYKYFIQLGFALIGALFAIIKGYKDALYTDMLVSGRKNTTLIKVLDGSCIIDGRIIDICDTNFLSGVLIVPRFVVNDLHQMSKSADQYKRARGRRGLDILSRLQEVKKVPIKIVNKEVPSVEDMDIKVAKFASEMNAQVVTTDFNMQKVSSLENVTVLNVNDLSTALKPVVLPGEQMSIFVMKEGREKNQGVGYLDDGTMVVVEEGKRWIGKRIEVAVYSILQANSGKMIFSRAKGQHKQPEQMTNLSPDI
jgi:uncharacterized protein YacL